MANGDTPIQVTGQPIPVTGQPSGAGAIQDLSSLLTQPQQPAAQTTTDQAAVPAQRDLSKENRYIVHATHYGYQGDPDSDPNSAKGTGAWDNKLTGGLSIALTPDLEQRFGAQPGEHFVFTDRNGAQHDFAFGDRTRSDLRGRIDVYDPTGQIGDLGEGTISRPGASGPAIPALETSNTEIQKQPAAFGMRVATEDDVKNYNSYIQNGGDPEQIPVYDRLAVAIAKNPGFLSDPKNFEAFYGLVYKPLQQQNTGEEFNKAIMNLGPTIGQTIGNVGQAIGNEAGILPTWAEVAFRKATGLTHDPGYQTVSNRLATQLATTAQGTGQAVGDAWNFVTGVADGLYQTSRPMAEMFTTDPQSKDQIDRSYARAMQTTVAGQQALAKLGNQLQDLAANSYKTTGAFADIGQKIQSAQPNEAAAQGIATIANPLNLIGTGAGEAAVGAFKPLFFEKGMQALEDAAGANARKLVLDSTQILPDNPELSAANPGYIETRNLQSQFAGAARNATQDANSAAATLNQQLTNVGKISGDIGTPTWFASQALQGAGTAIQTAGDLARKASGFPEWIANKISGGNPVFVNLIKSGVEKTIFGGALEALGPAGGMLEAGMEHLPEIADATSDLFKTAGKELMYGESTIPYWTRVAQQTDAMPKFMAAALDSPAVQTAAAIAKGGVAGAATGAVLGGLQQAGSMPGGGIGGAVSGAAQGGLLGMAGGGLGQWMRYRDPNQYLLQARGDWKRYRDMLPPDEQANFAKLSPTNQMVLAQSAQHFPGLKVNYTNDPTGPQGFHFFDTGNRSNIQINLANQDSVIRGIMAHELIHGATHSGMLPQLYDSLFGNPQTGQTGQFTALDSSGKPIGVNPATSRYFVDQNFTNLANHYTNLMAQNGLPTSHINDMTIAKEIYAEHGVDYLLSGSPILDSNSAFRPGLVSRNALKTALGKMGYTFDDAGRIVGGPNGGPPPVPGAPVQLVRGTGLFPGLQRSAALDNLAHSYFASEWRQGKIDSEEEPTHRFTKQDMQNPNVPETWLTNAAEIKRRQDGSVVRDPNTGLPIYRTPKEVKDYNATFAQAVRTALDTLPEDQRMDLGMRRNGDNIFARYLPDSILDSLAGTNQYNPHQIASLRMLSRVLADKGSPGMEMRLFYHKALTAGKTYRGFEGTEKIAVPYGIEVTGDNNVNIKSVDFEQLNKNYMRVRNREPFKSLWNAPDDFAQDAHTYFVNHSQGRPGSDAIGEQKRDAINSLSNFGTQLQRESNPLVETLPTAVRPIIKSYRIDRANQISATGAMRPFISEEQYYKMNRNYLPGAPEIPSYRPRETTPAPPDNTAIPVTMRTTRTGKEVAQEIPYDITKAPLVVDKQPPETLSGKNDFGHVDFLTKPDQQRLTHLNDASAVTDYADKLVAEHDRFKDNKQVMAAKNWYDDVLQHLKKGFGGDKELFAQLLAATSAQNGVRTNFADALEAYKQYRSGAYDDAIREFKRTGKITEDMKPLKSNGAKFGVNSDAVLKVLADKWMENVKGPKTPNFFRNLFKRGTDATIDMWAARTMRRLGHEGVEGADPQWRIQPASETGVSNLDFAFSQEAFKQAAQRLGMKPHQLQAILWYGEKNHWATQGWSKGGVSAAMESYIPQLKAYAAAPELAPPKADTRLAGKP